VTSPPPRQSPPRLRRLLARLSIRLLAFNLLLVFLPAAGLLYLDTYERQLLASQEREMVQQGRLLAAALAAPEGIDPWYADHLLRQLQRRHHSRLRVIDPNGFLIADSSQLERPPPAPGEGVEEGAAVTTSSHAAVSELVMDLSPGADRPASERSDAATEDAAAAPVAVPPDPAPAAEPAAPVSSDETAEDPSSPAAPHLANRDWLYRIGAAPFRFYRRLLGDSGGGLEASDYYAGKQRLLGGEVLAALAGRYGAATRLSGGQRSVTLYTAIPILWEKEVLGVTLVSQSTLGILQMLYEVRLDIFEVVLASFAAAAVLSLLVSTTIVRPLRRLGNEAAAIVDRRGRLQRELRGTQRHDEIGDLSRALEDLTRRLRQHVEFAESFASDVSHEFKNPLTAIRTATEILADAGDPADRKRFAAIVEREVARLERLLSAVREISRLDARLDREAVAPVEIGALLREAVDACRTRTGRGVRFELAELAQPCWVRAAAERLLQVFENLLDNAASFSADGAVVRVEPSASADQVCVAIADDGPGVPSEHRERIFDRFFSFRGGDGARHHTGLGLPIARAIVEGYGGTLTLADADRGARFDVRLPRAAAGRS